MGVLFQGDWTITRHVGNKRKITKSFGIKLLIAISNLAYILVSVYLFFVVAIFHKPQPYQIPILILPKIQRNIEKK